MATIMSACGGSGSGSYFGASNSIPKIFGIGQSIVPEANNSSETNFVISGTCSEEGSTITIAIGADSEEVICQNYSWDIVLDLSTLPDGNIEITLSEKKQNEEITSENLTVVKDTVPPTNIDNSTTSTTVVNSDNYNNYTISGACSEEGGDVTIEVSGTTFGPVKCSGSSYSIDVDLSALPDGNLVVNQIIKDAVGNELSSSFNITKDTQGPTATITTAVSANTNTSPSLMTITFDEDVSILDASRLTLTNANYVAATLATIDARTYTLQIAPTGQGLFSIAIDQGIANDLSGNDIGYSNTLSFEYDTVAPTITGVANDAILKESKTWNWNCDDSPCTYRYVIDQNPGTNPSGAYGATTTALIGGTGTYYLHVQAMDTAGNESAVTHVSTALQDLTIPLMDGLSDDLIVTNSKTHTWSCIDLSVCEFRFEVDQNPATNPSGAYGATTSYTHTTGDGTYYIHVQTRDAAGNESSVAHARFEMDTTGPVLTGLTNDSTPATTKTWNWGCIDTNTCTYRYIIDTGPATSPSGVFGAITTASQLSGDDTYYLHIQVQDAAGNTSAVEHYSAIVDNSNPVITGLSNDSNFTNSKTHTWGCDDASACEYRFVVDQNPSTIPTGGFSATATNTHATGNGTYYLHVQARDELGRLSTTVHVSFLMDTIAPVLTGLANDSNPAQTKTWNWGCTDTNTCSYRYVIDQNSSTNPSGAFGATTTASQNSGDGTYYIHVEVSDEAGNTSSIGHFSVPLDNTGPILTGVSNDATIAQTKTWNWSCTDANTCTYRFVVDQNSSTTPSGAYTATTTASQNSGDGSYYLHLQAIDSVGNTSSVGHYSVTLDNTDPVVTGLTNDGTTTASKTWNWSCSDASTCTYRYTVDKSPSTSPSGGYSATTSATQSTGFGTFYIHVQAVDQAGNISSVSHVYAIISASVTSGGELMTSALYSGDGATTNSISGVGFAPDLVWLKNRDSIGDNLIFNKEIGATHSVKTNEIDAQTTDANSLKSFDVSGFSLGSSSTVNNSGDRFVSWAFKENANFLDVVNYTGNSAHPQNVTHALGSTPGLMMIKNKSVSGDWIIYHQDMNQGETEPVIGVANTPARWIMNLNSDAGATHVNGSYFTNTNPTSTQFSVGSHTDVNNSGDNYIALLFSSNTANVIKTGVYTGNGSTTGPTVVLGHEPQWIMIKRKDSTGDWKIIDNSRSPANTRNLELKANLTDSEATNASVDFNATGFQIRTTDVDYNANTGLYIYIVIGN